MPEMPTLGPPQKSNPIVPVAITAVVVGALFGSLYWFKTKDLHDGPAQATVTAPAVEAPAVPSADAPTTTPPAVPVAAAAAPTTALPSNPSTPVVPTVDKPGMRAFTVAVNGPLESAIVGSEGKDVGTALTQVVNRSLVWWVRVPQDLVKGDTLSVLYETRDGQEPLVHAVRFNSRKMGKTFEAYRYQPQGAEFARYYQADGSELEERLVDSPLDTWEQVTSLLRDGRKHKGVDFKAPVGTPVKATFDGTIARKNWNFRGNGNSIEVLESGGKGRSALFLHLSELPKNLVAGQHVKRGEVIGKSGNTGHSFAPHLHYQLMQGEKVIDPFESHKTTRISLGAEQKPGFERKKNELEKLLPAAALAGG